MADPVPVFVVSTGRCGSTLISNALRAHPAVTSISEFLSSLGPRAFSAEVPVLAQVTEPDPHLGWLIAHGLEYPEVLYPFGEGSFERSGGIPPLLTSTLPHLDTDIGTAEERYRRLIADLGPSLEVAAPVEGYTSIFEWLRHDDDTDVWVERSGGSLRLLPKIMAGYPTARFVHIHRDGWATAQSMSRHSGFRMAILVRRLTAQLGADPFLDPTHDWAVEAPHLDPALAELLPDRFTADAFRDHEWRLRDFALLWSGLISTGVKALGELPADRVLHMRYETVLARPTDEMERLGSFVAGVAPPSWVDVAAALVHPPPPTSGTGEAPAGAARWLQGGREALESSGLVPPAA